MIFMTLVGYFFYIPRNNCDDFEYNTHFAASPPNRCETEFCLPRETCQSRLYINAFLGRRRGRWKFFFLTGIGELSAEKSRHLRAPARRTRVRQSDTHRWALLAEERARNTLLDFRRTRHRSYKVLWIRAVRVHGSQKAFFSSLTWSSWILMVCRLVRELGQTR